MEIDEQRLNGSRANKDANSAVSTQQWHKKVETDANPVENGTVSGTEESKWGHMKIYEPSPGHIFFLI